MSLAGIAAGRTVLIDTNILLYHAQGASTEASAFLERCASGEITGLLTSVILAEFGHRRMILEAAAAGLVTSNPARTLAQKPHLIRTLSAQAEAVRNLLDSALIFETLQKEDFVLALELQREHALLTNDSLNLAVARRLAIRDLATADHHFDQVPDVSVHRPDDLTA
jgi:predicted nucleic acid-binding protein